MAKISVKIIIVVIIFSICSCSSLCPGFIFPEYKMQHAIDRQDIDKIDELLVSTVNINDEFKIYERGFLLYRTPLVYAIEHRKIKATVHLLEKGADPNMACKDCYNPITLAADGWLMNIFQVGIYLLNTKYFEKKDYDDQTLIISKLIEFGADPNLKHWDLTPLIIALRDRNYALVYFLLQNGADPKVRIRTTSPLLELCTSWMDEKIDDDKLLLIKEFVNLGCNPNDIDAWGNSCLDKALPGKNEEIISYLIQQGAKENKGKLP